MNLLYLPWNMGAQAVKDLKEITGGLTIYPETSKYCTHKYHLKPNECVVIWGHGATPYWGAGVKSGNTRILNHWSRLSGAINKLKTFKLFKDSGLDVPAIPWTESIEKAAKWIAAGGVVLCRTELSGREGSGIVIAKREKDLVPCRLYTKVVPKDKEFRIHVFNGKVIDYTQKRLSHDAPKERDPYIRNTANGWVFCRQGVTITPALEKAAQLAIQAVGLDFGAVDIATKQAGGDPIVFEINTAPGIEGTTIKKYAEAINSWKESL